MAHKKTLTNRYQDPQSTGPVLLVFEHPEREGYRTVPGVVEAIEERRFGDLTDDDAQRENTASIAELQEGLRDRYPALVDETIVEVVNFHLKD